MKNQLCHLSVSPQTSIYLESRRVNEFPMISYHCNCECNVDFLIQTVKLAKPLDDSFSQLSTKTSPFQLRTQWHDSIIHENGNVEKRQNLFWSTRWWQNSEKQIRLIERGRIVWNKQFTACSCSPCYTCCTCKRQISCTLWWNSKFENIFVLFPSQYCLTM